MSNRGVCGCLLLSGWKIEAKTCKHRGNGCGAASLDSHTDTKVLLGPGCKKYASLFSCQRRAVLIVARNQESQFDGYWAFY